MTPEELLIPRVIVINDFPQSNFNPLKKGDILIKNGIHFTRIGIAKSINEDEINKYPAIFKFLDWHEYRKIEDMPMYIKRSSKVKVDEYLKIFSWEDDGTGEIFYREVNDEIGWYPWQFEIIPINESDYLNKKQKND